MATKIKPSYKVRSKDGNIMLTIGDPDGDNLVLTLDPEQAFEMARQITVVTTFTVMHIEAKAPGDE